MSEKVIRKIYKEFYKGIIAPKPTKGENSDTLEKYYNDYRYYLYVDDGSEYHVVTEETMRDLYNDGKQFHSGMFNNDDYKQYKEHNDEIKNYVSFKMFCIHNELEALQKLGIEEDEIVKTIQDRWDKNES